MKKLLGTQVIFRKGGSFLSWFFPVTFDDTALAGAVIRRLRDLESHHAAIITEVGDNSGPNLVAFLDAFIT